MSLGRNLRFKWVTLAVAMALSAALAAGAKGEASGEDANFPPPINEATKASLLQPGTDGPTYAGPITGIGDSRAVEVLSDSFGSDLSVVPDFLMDPSLIQQYLGNTSALVEDGNGSRGLLDAGVRLKANGSPVDLSLHRENGAFVPENPLVQVSLPVSSEGGFTFKEAGIRITPATSNDADGVKLDSGGVVYPNSSANKDLALVPVPGGIETFSQIRSPEASHVDHFDFAMPSNASLEKTSGGGAQVTQDGDSLVTVSAPVANDATGKAVPVNLSVAGNRLSLTVNSNDDDVEYPILVDPVIEIHSWGGTTSTTGMSSWTSTMNNPNPGFYLTKSCPGYPFWCYSVGGVNSTGLYAGALAGNYPAGGGANWTYSVPRYDSDFTNVGVHPTSYVSQAAMYSIYQHVRGDTNATPTLIASTFDPSTTYFGALSGFGGSEIANGSVTLNPTGTAAQLMKQQQVSFGYWLLAARSLPVYRDAYVGLFSAILKDAESPTITLTPPNQWTKNTAIPVGISAKDEGLGVKSVDLETPSQSQIFYSNQLSCKGTAVDPCPRTLNGTASVNPSTLPEGAQDLVSVAYDALQKDNSAVARVKVDRSQPKISTSGSLTNTNRPGGTLVVDVQDNELTSPTYDVDGNLTSTLGTGDLAKLRSGAKSVDVFVDNTKVFHSDRTCTAPNGSCRLGPFTVPVDLSQLDNGLHDIRVEAEDQVGNIASKTWQKRTDTVMPNVEIVSPQPPEWITSDHFNLSVAGTDEPYGIARLVVKRGGSEVGSKTLDCSSGSSCPTEVAQTIDVNSSGFSEGENNLDVSAVGPANDEGVPAHFKVGVDRVAPTVVSSSFPTWVGSSAPLVLHATNAGSGISSVLLKGPSGSVLGSKTMDCNPQCPTDISDTIEADTSSLSEGSRTATILVKAPSGQETEKPVTFSVDHTAPQLDALGGALTGLAGTLTARVDNVALTTGARDTVGTSNSGMASVVASERQFQSWSSTSDCVTSSCETLTFGVPLAQIGDGEQTISVVARDKAGNSTSREIPLILDRSGPDISIQPSEGQLDEWNRSDDLKFSVSFQDIPADVGFGTASSSVEVDGVLVAPESCSSDCETRTYKVPSVSTGAHVITAHASDSNSNNSDISSTVNFDRDAPTTEISGDLAAGGEIGAGEVSLSVDAEDQVTGSTQAGVESISVWADKRQVEYIDQDCESNGCGLSGDFSLDESDLPPGKHLVEVRTRDFAGNVHSDSISVDRVCPVAGPSTVSTTNPISVSGAISTIAADHPDVTAPSEPVNVGGETLTPTLVEGEGALDADETETSSQVSESDDSAFMVGDDAGAVCLVPTKVSNQADPATVVNEDSALYPNTLQDSDTVVRPTVDGAESFTMIRSDDAPEQFSWNVGADASASLSSVSNSEVAVRIPASTLNVPEPPTDVPALEGQASDLVADGDLPPGTTDLNPDAQQDGETDIDETVTDQPSQNQVESELPVAGPSVVGTPPSLPTPDAADARAAVETANSESMTEREDLIDASIDSFVDHTTSAVAEGVARGEDAADQSLEDAKSGQVEIATISAPSAKDADGEDVPTSLSATGDTVSLHVDHDGEGFDYPIAADPYVTVSTIEIQWEKFAVYRDEYYVSGREFDLRQIGWWNSKNCKWVSCVAGSKAGWWKIPGDFRVWLPSGIHSGAVGPKFEGYWKPVFSKRKVFDHWGRKAVQKVVKKKVWVDAPSESAEDLDAPSQADYFDDQSIQSYPTDADDDGASASSGAGHDELPDSWFEGMSVLSFQRNTYNHTDDRHVRVAQTIRDEMGMDTEVLLPFWYFSSNSDRTMEPIPDLTASDASIKTAAANARKSGLRIVIKPQLLNQYDGAGRLDRTKMTFEPGLATFWRTYWNMMSGYACLAKQVGARDFVLGTELEQLQNDKNEDNWLTLIDKVKYQFQRNACQPQNPKASHAAPKLIYAANWDSVYDGGSNDWQPPKWWKSPDLKFIGVDYYPSRSKTPPVSDMYGRLALIHSRLPSKRVFFSEVGANRNGEDETDPHFGTPYGTSKGKTQKGWYKAVITLAANRYDPKDPWFAGFFWWNKYALNPNKIPPGKEADWKTFDAYTPWDREKSNDDAVGMLCHYQCGR